MKNKKTKPSTYRPLCRFTEAEEQAIQRAIDRATAFMEKFGNGRLPYEIERSLEMEAETEMARQAIAIQKEMMNNNDRASDKTNSRKLRRRNVS